VELLVRRGGVFFCGAGVDDLGADLAAGFCCLGCCVVVERDG
jgi:hypothetical protein